MQNARLMSVADLADYLGVTPAWVYNNHRALKIPVRKIGGHLRFRPSDIERWIDSQDSAAA